MQARRPKAARTGKRNRRGSLPDRAEGLEGPLRFDVQRVEFESDELKLVGDLHLPDEPHPLGAVVLHPHPLYGGDRRNNVTRGVAAGLAESGFPALTFDFRGAGESQGSHGGGGPEVKDVEAAITELTARVPDVAKVAIVGYSFGAHVASLALQGCKPAAVVCVAPPVSLLDMEGLCGFVGPILILSGDTDQFGPIDQVTSLAERSGAELQRLSGADHFLWGREAEVARKVVDFLDRSTGL